MTAFRTLLITLCAALFLYTSVVIMNHGWNLLPIFFGDMAKLGWPGQFNLDFMFMLTLSAVWVAWRHEFSKAGLSLALAAFFGGAAFLTVYLLVVSVQTKGDVTQILLGALRAKGGPMMADE